MTNNTGSRNVSILDTLDKPTPPENSLDKVNRLKEVDAFILAADHATIIADDLAKWADEADGDHDLASRWRAVAETRRMASDRWAAASHKVRSELA